MSGTANLSVPLSQAQLFACTNNLEDRRSLLQTIRDWVAYLPRSLEAEIDLNDLEMDKSSLGDAVTTEAGALPDVIISLCGHNDTDIRDQLSLIFARISHLLTPSSSVLGARRYQILGGEGPIRLFYAVSRLPHMDREQFFHYWLHHHADIGRQLLPPCSYMQSHSDTESSATLGAATGLPCSEFDGVVTIHYPDVDAYLRQISREEVVAIALEDEKKFIDHSRVLFGIYSVMQF